METRTATVFLSLVLWVSTLAVTEGAAQSCFGGYERNDRGDVKLLIEAPIGALNRLAELAQLSASGELSQPQRMALQNEFRAHLTGFMNPYRNHSRPWLSARARAFLSDVLDPEYLALEDLRLVGGTPEESITLSLNALNQVNNALNYLQTCAWGSWDRLTFSGQSSKRCFGGFMKFDAEYLQNLGNSALTVLAELRQQAQAASTAIDPVGEREKRNLDFIFTREEIKILGSETGFYPINEGSGYRSLSNEGRVFMHAIFDPASLNLANATLQGDTLADAQANARAAVDAINRAEKRIKYCIFDGGGN